MNKRDFLKISGLAGVATVIPTNIFASEKKEEEATVCTLIPTETAGPFPLDLTSNTFYFRQDIRETELGVPLKLKMKINGIGNCGVMQNVRVNIWHCNSLGKYSGYGTEVGKTYLRGYQITDVNGEVEFLTIFPGWYPGRVCHFHFQVFVSSAYSVVSQFTFNNAEKNAVYTANPTLYPLGVDPVNIANDGFLSNAVPLQVATLTPNTDIGGYESYFEVGVQGNGTLGVGYFESQNALQFTMGQNYPNPYDGETTIPLTLKNNSEVKMELWDLNGRNLGAIYEGNLAAGEHQIPFITSSKLATGNYIYQMILENENGVFKDSKMMTAK
jgi:protocatechuate 3,4-dioxygenase beta subunit